MNPDTDVNMIRRSDKIELLAPAGSFESLRAAVINGADAVYLGGGKHNARMGAGNFIADELRKAFDYAHERGVRIYLTLNTLIKNTELDEALKLADFACREGADAIIVQDLGLMVMLGKYFPDLPIHASTQMTVTSSESVAVLEALGVKRVVLARELSLGEIRSIAHKSKAELEIFVHGALCVCYSGQCLMSSFIGGRSGNRGACAQPCRLPWSLSGGCGGSEKDAYLISPRDLMAVELLPEIRDAGATSLKLEGRMKSPEYVAIATSIYRKYLDILESGVREFKVDETDREKLMQAFNRGGFTQSYLKGERDFSKLVYTKHPKNQGSLIGKVTDSKPLYVRVKLDKPLHMGDGIEIMDERKGPQSIIVTSIVHGTEHSRFAGMGTEPWIGDVKTAVAKGSEVYKTLSKPLFEEARMSFAHGDRPMIPLDMKFSLKTGCPAVLVASDHNGTTARAESEEYAQRAMNKPLTKKRIEDQLKKTGGTPYWLRNLTIESDGESIIPISALNGLRREVLERIGSQRIEKFKRPLEMLPEQPSMVWENTRNSGLGRGIKNFPGDIIGLTIFFYEYPDNIADLESYAERIYIPVLPVNLIEKIREQFPKELYIWTPPVLKDPELVKVREAIGKVSGIIDGISYGSLGAFKVLREAFPQKEFCADVSMNLFNDRAAAVQHRLGANTGVLSPELSFGDIKAFSGAPLALESIVYGRLPLMTMEHCLSAAEKGCSGMCERCNGKRGLLKDRKGEIFPFVRDPILKRTQIFNSVPVFMDESAIFSRTPVSLFRLIFTWENAETRTAVVNHFAGIIHGREDSNSGNRKIIKTLKIRGFTKGHWFRGV